jgi:hypothetical protein
MHPALIALFYLLQWLALLRTTRRHTAHHTIEGPTT